MISVVIPAYYEEDGIAEIYNRIGAASPACGHEFEIPIVDDGSRDRTLEICARIAAADPRLKLLSLSRNFGHQAAVSAGIMNARGAIVTIMDADLQDPPEELLPFIQKIREGWDVVYAIRTKRKENLLKRFSYSADYRILKHLAALCMFGAVFVIVQYATNWTVIGFNPRAARGWTSTIFVILFLASVNLLCMGILGEYIGRLFEEVKQRPIWVVKKRINL